MQDKLIAITDTSLYEDITYYLDSAYQIYHEKNIDIILNLLRSYIIKILIIQIDGNLEVIGHYLRILKNQFIQIPKLAISTDHSLEAARICGELGVYRVVSDQKLNTLKEIIPEIIHTQYFSIPLKEFGIEKDKCSDIVNNALEIIEKNYLSINSVRQIEEVLGIPKYSLSSEFIRSEIINPKKLLILLKIKHSEYLMKNPGLNLTEIANLAGFSDLRRFNENFHRVFGSSPEICRRNILVEGISKFWMDNLNNDFL